MQASIYTYIKLNNYNDIELTKEITNEIIKRFITCCILCKGAARSRRLPAGKSCTSPLVITLPSLAAANSRILAPLTTRPAITPKNGRSTLPLLRFHRPPTWIVDWLLNTVSWWPVEIHKFEFIFTSLTSSSYII